MSRAYWSGVGAGLLLVALGGYGLFWVSSRDRAAVADSQGVTWDPQVTDLSDRWILPGAPQTFRVQLHNRLGCDVWIDEMRFSLPCASGAIGKTSRFPVRLASGKTLPVEIVVVSRRGERGRMKLHYGVIGRRILGSGGGDAVNTGAVAEIQFAQAVNSEPTLVAFGPIRQSGPPPNAQVQLWRPSELNLTAKLEAQSNDPAVSAEIEPLPVHQQSHAPGVRVPIAKVVIAVNPRHAAERMHAEVTIRAGNGELRIPVFGVVTERSPAMESRP